MHLSLFFFLRERERASEHERFVKSSSVSLLNKSNQKRFCGRFFSQLERCER